MHPLRHSDKDFLANLTNAIVPVALHRMESDETNISVAVPAEIEETTTFYDVFCSICISRVVENETVAYLSRCGEN